ncbi:hypothetical protein LWC34_52135 [Kibdelosporangium philippinense]|uniref:Uncharacterized protein n=1 Tax=Kibdelosporangium philippinense TaxID=211113 RepID=A0ABS8ZWA9_9PSEU|nr:hypothetical protein [Kibdelosporangium philippinense]MCE7011305.1 hypothetical protein [Kibdelosporangium philippinense]
MLNLIMAGVIAVTATTGGAVTPAAQIPAEAPPAALAICDSVTQIMLCKPMDTLSLPPEPTIGDARVEAKRRYGQLPWVCDLNIAGRVEVETCVFPVDPDTTPLRIILSR